MRSEVRQSLVLTAGVIAVLYIALTFVSTLYSIWEFVGEYLIQSGIVLALSFLILFVVGYRLSVESSVWLGAYLTARGVLEERGWVSPRTLVEGRILYNDIRWPGEYYIDNTIDIGEPECPHCGLKLVETHLDQRMIESIEADADSESSDEHIVDGLDRTWFIEAEESVSATLVEALDCPQCIFWAVLDH